MAVILGAIAYSPRILNPPHLAALADSLDTFALDFTSSATGFYFTGDKPYKSSMPVGLHGPITNNLPTTVTTFTIAPGHIAKSFLYDWYFRIHITYTLLELGNILSDEYINIELWNAYFQTNTLNVVTGSGIEDIILTFPFSLPHTFKQLDYALVEAHVLAEGTPSIDGYYDFPFTTETVRMYVTGQRVLLWPFIANSDFSETKSWLTDVIKVRGGETRYALRDKPRRVLKYSYVFKDQVEYGRACNLAKGIVHTAIAVPLFTDVTKIENLAQGATEVFFNTTDLEFEAGSIIAFWRSYDTYELQEVLTVTTTSVTLKNPLQNSWYYCWVFPVYIGYPTNGISLSRNQNGRLTGELSVETVYPYTNSTWTPSETYLGLPLFTDKDIVSGGKFDNYARELEAFDSDIGDVVKFSAETYTRAQRSMQLKAREKAELYNLRRRFDYLQGMYQAFWVSSKLDAYVALSDITAGGNTLTVSYAALSKESPKYIRIIGTSIINVEVISVIDNLDGTETISFTPNAPADVSSISSIEELTKVRLNSDSVTFDHSISDVTVTKTNLLEVLA